jgi:hypothetical protein
MKTIFRQILKCIVLIQGISTIFIDQLPASLVSEKCILFYHQNFQNLPHSLTNLKNDKSQFKTALKKYFNAHSCYSVDEFFVCIDDL